VNGESIRGTSRTPLPPQTWGQSTQRGNRLYLHVFDWPRDRRLHVAGLTAPVSKAWLLAEPNAPALPTHTVGPRDVEIEVPAAPTDRWLSVIVVDVAGPVAPDSVLYLPAKGSAVRLHVFDGRLVGEGIRYGDGKRGRDVTQGWSAVGSGVEWRVRVAEPARYRVAVEYAAAAPADTGHFTITIGELRLSGRVSPTGGDALFATRDVGDVALAPGEYVIGLRAALVVGPELMRLRRLVLTPVARPE
jgi:alpha-L-fucosidase